MTALPDEVAEPRVAIPGTAPTRVLTDVDKAEITRLHGDLTILGVPIFVAPRAMGSKDEFVRPTGWPNLTVDGNNDRLARWRPGMAVCAVTGGALVVVDVDPRNGGRVEGVRDKLGGLGVSIFAEVQTPGGGVHFYVAGHQDIASGSHLPGWPGVDIQSDGRNVYLPGTSRPSYEGRGYRIVRNDLAALADGGNLSGAVSLAGALAEAKATGGMVAESAGEMAPPWDGTPISDRARAYLDSSVRQAANRVAQAATGGRNSRLNAETFALARLAASTGYPPDKIIEAMVTACMTNGLIADDGGQSVDATIRSAIQSGMLKPRTLRLADRPGLYGRADNVNAASGTTGQDEEQFSPDNGKLSEDNTTPTTGSEADSEALWLERDPEQVGAIKVVLPSFPTGVFSDSIADMIEAVAEFSQTDPGMAGTTALGVLAGAAGGKVEVIAEAGWREPTNLYLATAAKPGERKSAVQAVMTAPLSEVEQELVQAQRAVISNLKTEKDIAERAAANSAAKAAKATSSDYNKLLADAVSDAERAEGIVVPPMPRIIADDVTPEAATSLLAEHGRLAVISAEGGIFDIIEGRYTNVPNLDVWLKGHAGDRVKVDRKGRESEYIERPALTVAVMIQPAVLDSIARNAQLRGRGLVARFLFSLPPSRVGYRMARPAPIPVAVEERYQARIATLTRELAARDKPIMVTLDESARAVLAEFQISVEVRLRSGSDLAQIADWATKLPGAAVRIAGLLHVAGTENYEKRCVTAVSMKNAVTLAEYFIDHALAAFDLMGTDPVKIDALTILDALIAKEVENFSVRELRRTIVRSRLASGDPKRALQHLVNLGWLLPQPTESSSTGRPPSPAFKVHPKARNARNAQNERAK